MFFTLTKYSLMQFLKASRISRKGKFRIPQWMTYVAVTMLFVALFLVPAKEIATSMASIGLQHIYFALLYLGSSVILLMTNVALAQNSLFKSKYNDLLLSMPIRNSDILLSRLAEIYVQNLITQIMFWIPSMAGYFAAVGFDIVTLLIAIVCMLVAPIIFIALGSVLGYYLNKISSKLKHPNLVKAVLTFALLGAYYYFVFSSEDMISDLIYNANHVDEVLSWILPATWLGNAIGDKNVINLLLFVAINAAVMALLVIILQRDYDRVMTASQAKAEIKYVRKELKTHGVLRSLIGREFRHIMSSYTYLINTTIGLMFIAAGAVYIIVGHKSITEMFYFDDMQFMAMFICFFVVIMIETMISTYLVSASSISLEGQSIFNLKSLPIESRTVLFSKLLFHYVLAAPFAMLTSVVAVVFFKPSLLTGLLTIIVPQMFLLMTGSLGLCLNLLYYKLDWTNEAQCVKRGGAVGLMIMGNYMLIGLQVAPYILWLYEAMDVEIYVLVVCVVMVILTAFLLWLIANWGCRRYESIGE